MKSDIITIDNQGSGFSSAVELTKKVAAYEGLKRKDSVKLQMLTEEMLSLARSVTGEMTASFWIEFENRRADLHMTTTTVMDSEKRQELISAASSRKNEAAKTFLGRVRDIFEQAMVADPERCDLPEDVLSDIPQDAFVEPEWDGYERSILNKLADEVKVGIRGGEVNITVSRNFGE